MLSQSKKVALASQCALLTLLLFPPAMVGAVSVSYREGVSPTAGFVAEDADLREGSPSANLPVSNINLGSISTGGNQRGRTVISFDLDATGGFTVADAGSITNVALTLTLRGRFGSWTSYTASQRLIELHALTNNFSEGTVTWNSPWINPGGDYSSTVLSSFTDDLSSSTFTFPSSPAFIAAAQNALNNNGGVLSLLLLAPNAEGLSSMAWLELDSSDRPGGSALSANALNRPLLIVQIPEPGAMSLLGLGGLLLWRWKRKS